MKAIRVRTHLDSDTVHIPELAEMVGKDVEIIVVEDVRDLAIRRPITPIRDVKEIVGGWPGDVDDGIEEWYRAERHRREPRILREPPA